MGPLTSTKKWQTEQIAGVVRFRDRVYNVVKKVAAGDVKKDSNETIVLLHKTMKKVTDDVEQLSYNTAISSMIILVNQIMKDGGCSKDTANKLTVMISPFAPHLGEECWELLGNTGFVADASWVSHDEKLCVEDLVKIGVQVNGKFRAEMEITKEASEQEAIEMATEIEAVEKFVSKGGGKFKKVIYVPGRILNLIV